MLCVINHSWVAQGTLQVFIVENCLLYAVILLQLSNLQDVLPSVVVIQFSLDVSFLLYKVQWPDFFS